jgi:hypothetical protein
MADVVDHGVEVPGRIYTASVTGRVVRALALVVLVLAILTVVTSWAAPRRSTEDLSADLAAGRVTYVEYASGTRTVRWVVDLVLWRQAQLPAQPDVPADGNPTNGSTANGNTANGNTANGTAQGSDVTWLEQQITASGHPVRLAEFDGTSRRLWLQYVPWPPLAFAAAAVWLLTLIHMLAAGGHRVANRWAWFWMFTFGQLGAVPYLLFEPVPLWRSQLPVTGRRPIGGGMGLVYSVLLGFAGAALSMVAVFAFS